MMGNITTKYGQPIQEAANKYGLDWKVLLTIVMKESGGNPKAVSYCGAEGLTQLMPRTAKELGVKNSFNPKENIHGGAKYFSKMLKKFDGNLELALLAYNHGPATVNKLMEKEGENFNPRNYEYVKRVMHILGFEFENFEVV
jgi:soluble lytic murein transglycosylase-like protein